MADEITQDTLFIACTRPPMLWGVPMQAAIGNAMAVMMLFILVKNPLYLTIGILTHWFMRQIVSRDYNMFGVWGLWFMTKARATDVKRWGGSSISPHPAERAQSHREIRAHV